MPDTTPSAHFATVFKDYLESAAALAVTGVPTTTQIQRRSKATTDALAQNRLDIDVSVESSEQDMVLVLRLELTQTTQIGTETGQITRAVAQGYFQAIRALLSDDHIATWDAFNAVQTDAYKQGWLIQAIWPGDESEDVEPEENLLRLKAAWQVHTFWNTRAAV